MKISRLLILPLISVFALSSCGILKCERCAAKQAAARAAAVREYEAAQSAAATVTTPTTVPAPATNQ